jgi:carboxyl-terminal processing protease
MNLSLEGIGATLQSEEDETSIKSLVPGAPAERSFFTIDLNLIITF